MYRKINVFGQHWVTFIWYAFSWMAFMWEAWPEPKSIKTFGSECSNWSCVRTQKTQSTATQHHPFHSLHRSICLSLFLHIRIPHSRFSSCWATCLDHHCCCFFRNKYPEKSNQLNENEWNRKRSAIERDRNWYSRNGNDWMARKQERVNERERMSNKSCGKKREYLALSLHFPPDTAHDINLAQVPWS